MKVLIFGVLIILLLCIMRDNLVRSNKMAREIAENCPLSGTVTIIVDANWWGDELTVMCEYPNMGESILVAKS